MHTHAYVATLDKHSLQDQLGKSIAELKLARTPMFRQHVCEQEDSS
jgi:hypothetical protein